MNDLLPAPPDREIPPSVEASVKRAVMSEIARQGTGRTTVRPRRSVFSVHRRRRTLAVAVAALALALVVPVVFGNRDGGSPTASAEEILTRAAQGAASQPPLSVGRGQYLLRETRSMRRILCTSFLHGPECRALTPDGGEFTLLVTLTRKTWSSADGDGLIAERLVDVDFETAADAAAWKRSGLEIKFWGNFSVLGPGGESSMCPQSDTTLEDLDSLPSDSDAIEQLLRDRVVQGDIADGSRAKQTSAMFEEIGSQLLYPGSSDRRAALFEVLARQPGIEVLGLMTDHVGRTGTGIGATWNGVRSEMIVDTSHGKVLEFRAAQVDPVGSLQGGAPGTPAPGVGVNSDGVDAPGTLLGWSTQVRLDAVDSLPRVTGNCAGYPNDGT